MSRVNSQRTRLRVERGHCHSLRSCKVTSIIGTIVEKEQLQAPPETARFAWRVLRRVVHVPVPAVPSQEGM